MASPITSPRSAVNEICAGASAGFEFHLRKREQDPLMPSKADLEMSFSKQGKTASMATSWGAFCEDVTALARRAVTGDWDKAKQEAANGDASDAAQQ